MRIVNVCHTSICVYASRRHPSFGCVWDSSSDRDRQQVAIDCTLPTTTRSGRRFASGGVVSRAVHYQSEWGQSLLGSSLDNYSSLQPTSAFVSVGQVSLQIARWSLRAPLPHFRYASRFALRYRHRFAIRTWWIFRSRCPLSVRSFRARFNFYSILIPLSLSLAVFSSFHVYVVNVKCDRWMLCRRKMLTIVFRVSV